jgi:hypothetical protein
MLVAALAAIIFGVPGLMFGPEDARLIFTGLVFLPLIVFVVQVLYFTFTDPDRLQNDRHVEQKMRIQHQIAMKTGGKTITIDVPRDAALVENPKAAEPSSWARPITSAMTYSAQT